MSQYKHSPIEDACCILFSITDHASVSSLHFSFLSSFSFFLFKSFYCVFFVYASVVVFLIIRSYNVDNFVYSCV